MATARAMASDGRERTSERCDATDRDHATIAPTLSHRAEPAASDDDGACGALAVPVIFDLHNPAPHQHLVPSSSDGAAAATTPTGVHGSAPSSSVGRPRLSKRQLMDACGEPPLKGARVKVSTRAT